MFYHFQGGCAHFLILIVHAVVAQPRRVHASVVKTPTKVSDPHILHFIYSDNFVVNEKTTCRSHKPTLVSLYVLDKGFYVFLYCQQFVDLGPFGNNMR